LYNSVSLGEALYVGINNIWGPTGQTGPPIYDAGNIQVLYTPGNPGLGRTSYLPVAGLFGDTRDGNSQGPGGAPGGYVRYRGAFYADSKTKVAALSDGTSNTLAFGETLFGPPTNRQFAATWMASGPLPTYWELAAMQPADIWPQFGSMHDGVILFAYCDGTVHSFRRTNGGSGSPHWYDLAYAAGTNDGASYNLADLE
jgi:hypothetical protein